MKSLWMAKPLAYDGSQLRSLYAYLEHGLMGDSVISFEGPCSVSFEHMLDGEDLVARSPIAGERMTHFLIEKFHAPLLAGVALQRLFASLCLDLLRETARTDLDRRELRRDGDDIFWRDRKFSISIATVSPVSTLIHFAVNSVNRGTPVPTCALEDFGLEASAFAKSLMERFTSEMESIEQATYKVRWAR